uniref:RING-type domain-containing protein n=1 Tax=Chelydra serpentina TaxID=8475 RepID=A0A8C3XVA4_CHESE
MATMTPVREIQEVTKCPICLEYLTDPVTTHCGHNFCRGCITKYCETWTKGDYDPLCCPRCRALIRKGDLRNNYQPGNILEKIKNWISNKEKRIWIQCRCLLPSVQRNSNRETSGLTGSW